MKRSSAVIAGLLLLAIRIGAQDVKTDHDVSANFAKYKTYMWTKGTPAPSPFTEDRIRNGVNQNLAAKGLKPVDANADMVVATHVVTQQQKELVAQGFGGPRFGGMGSASMQTLIQGSLVLDFYDAGTKNLVWRGVGTETFDEVDPQKIAKKIDKALEKMFKEYPPKSKS